MTRLVLEAAGPGDTDALLALEQSSFSHPWTRAHFEAALAAPDRGRVVVVRDYGVPGRALRAHCVVAWAADEIHVHNLAVEPGSRRRGLGRWLVVQELRLGTRRGARRAFLEVRSGNDAARALYHSCGFRPLYVRPGYYRDPVEDALVLTTDLD